MADIQQIRDRIRELAQSPKNVSLSDLEAIVNQLGQNGYRTRIRKSTHGQLLSINTQRINVCFHNRGSGQLKACYVKQFIRAMIELGLYDPD